MKKTVDSLSVRPPLADLSATGTAPLPDAPDYAEAQLLAPYRMVGSVLASDGVGLSRMARTRDLVEVLALLAASKRRIHATISSLGGRAIGRWSADNTLSFFSEPIPVGAVRRAAEAILDAHPAHEPQVGLALHYGIFYHIAGALYGPDAERVERLAEEHSRGGDLIVTPAAAARCGVLPRVVAPATDDHAAYPAPYPHDFAERLRSVESAREAARAYRTRGSVLVIHRRGGRERLVNQIINDVRLAALVRDADAGRVRAMKQCAALSILLLPSPRIALDVAAAVHEGAPAIGLSVSSGVDHGELLCFPMEDGSWEFAGDPVNVASKLAEDWGEAGWHYHSDRAAAMPPVARRFRWGLGEIALEARGLRLVA